MKKLTLDDRYLKGFITDPDIEILQEKTISCHKILLSGEGPGNQFLGWVNLPENYDKEEMERIRRSAERIRSLSDAVVVIGIGGSYLGARAAIESLGHTFGNQVASSRDNPEIYFAGINLSGSYISHLMEILQNKDFSIIVISKSGTTLEPAIAFRILRKEIVKRYGVSGSKERIVAITDRDKGALKTLAAENGYESFVVPDDVGGRYSVLTPVGLLPIAIAGIDIQNLMNGAGDALSDFRAPFTRNPCLRYAAMRNILYRKGKIIEMLVSYEPGLISFGEWWKQLFGESEGKEGKGIFPATSSYTMDLHSMGQYIQEGPRHIFETLLQIDKDPNPVEIPYDENNLDGLNFISGKPLHFVNQKASEGTLEAHVQGGVPTIVIHVPEMSPFQLGYLFYFFEKSCAISGCLSGINPFDQPGVEAYKKNMYRLLGKK